MLLCMPQVQRAVKLAKTPKLLQAALLLLMLVYACLGAIVFQAIEEPTQRDSRIRIRREHVDCLRTVLQREQQQVFFVIYAIAYCLANESIVESLVSECLDKSMFCNKVWSYSNAFFFAFGIMTTIGYGSVSVESEGGKFFEICFGVIGIPLTMLIIGNLGKFVSEVLVALRDFLKRHKQRIYRFCRCCSSKSSPMTLENGTRGVKEYALPTEENKEEEEAPGELDPLIVILSALTYMALGTAFWNFIDSVTDVSLLGFLYSNFLTIMALDFGPLVANKTLFLLPLVLVYICIGVAITSMALEVGSVYLKQLHYLGAKIANCKFVKIWFGSKTMTVDTLVNAVGRGLDVPQEKVDSLDLDSLINDALSSEPPRTPTPTPKTPTPPPRTPTPPPRTPTPPPRTPTPPPRTPTPPPRTPTPPPRTPTPPPRTPTPPPRTPTPPPRTPTPPPRTPTPPPRTPTPPPPPKPPTFAERRKAVLAAVQEMKDSGATGIRGGKSGRTDPNQLRKVYEQEWQEMERRKAERLRQLQRRNADAKPNKDSTTTAQQR